MRVVARSVSTSRTATLASPAASTGLERNGLDTTLRGTAAEAAAELMRKFRLFMRDTFRSTIYGLMIRPGGRAAEGFPFTARPESCDWDVPNRLHAWGGFWR